MEIICVSDTHDLYDCLEHTLPPADVFVHAGDITNIGLREDLVRFNDWLGGLDYEHKIVIGGAHDTWGDELPARAQDVLTNCTFLMDSEVVIQGVRFYGTPVQPAFYDWAYTDAEESELQRIVDAIPEGTDVLITHVPPYGVLDTEEGANQGSPQLLERVLLIHPKIHIFGHVHDQHGTMQKNDTIFVNAAICDVGHKPIHRPICFDI